MWRQKKKRNGKWPINRDRSEERAERRKRDRERESEKGRGSKRARKSTPKRGI